MESLALASLFVQRLETLVGHGANWQPTFKELACHPTNPNQKRQQKRNTDACQKESPAMSAILACLRKSR
jgi:hypothetical protein